MIKTKIIIYWSGCPPHEAEVRFVNNVPRIGDSLFHQNKLHEVTGVYWRYITPVVAEVAEIHFD